MNPLAQEACTEMSDSGDTKSGRPGADSGKAHSVMKSRLPRACQRCYGAVRALSAEVGSLALSAGVGVGWGWGGGGDCLAKQTPVSAPWTAVFASPARRSFPPVATPSGTAAKRPLRNQEKSPKPGGHSHTQVPGAQRVGLSGKSGPASLTLWPDTKVGAQPSCFSRTSHLGGCPCHGWNRTQPRVTCAEASRCQ